MEELDPTARTVWKLARNHTWGQPMSEEDVIAIATKDEDNDGSTQLARCRTMIR